MTVEIREILHAELERFYRIAGIAEDITERENAEEQLKATSEQLRALSANLSSAREEEGTRIARELHDEMGSALTSLKWELESIEKLCSEAGNQAESSNVREKIKGMMEVIDATLNAVLRISSELRPTILEEGEFAFEIRDNGRGITEDEITGSRSLGLIGMRERAHLAGGRIEIIGIGARGTVLILRVPIHSQDEQLSSDKSGHQQSEASHE